MLKELFTAAQLAVTGQISTKLSDNKDVKSAEWYNFTNQTWEVRDAATHILLDLILPYTHVIRNMDYPLAIEIDNKNYQYLAPAVMDVNGNAGSPFFLYNLSLCAQAEVQEAFTLPTSNKLLLDTASGFYNLYGLSDVYFAHTCKKVVITSRVPFGMQLEAAPYVIENGVYISQAPSVNFNLTSGEPLELEGNFNKITFGAGSQGLDTLSMTLQKTFSVEVKAYYDPANPGLPPIDSLVPSMADGTPGANDLLSVYGAHSGHQVIHNFSLAATTYSMVNVGYANGLTTSFLGNQRTQILAVNSTESYSLWVYPCIDIMAFSISAKGTEIATSVPATAYSPAFPTTSMDGSLSTTNLSTPYDLYDLGALVGIFPAYQIVVENNGAATATITIDEFHYNNPIQ